MDSVGILRTIGHGLDLASHVLQRLVHLVNRILRLVLTGFDTVFPRVENLFDPVIYCFDLVLQLGVQPPFKASDRVLNGLLIGDCDVCLGLLQVSSQIGNRLGVGLDVLFGLHQSLVQFGDVTGVGVNQTFQKNPLSLQLRFEVFLLSLKGRLGLLDCPVGGQSLIHPRLEGFLQLLNGCLQIRGPGFLQILTCGRDGGLVGCGDVGHLLVNPFAKAGDLIGDLALEITHGLVQILRELLRETGLKVSEGCLQATDPGVDARYLLHNAAILRQCRERGCRPVFCVFDFLVNIFLKA